MPQTRSQTLHWLQNQPSPREQRAKKRDEVRNSLVVEPIKTKKEYIKSVKKEDLLRKFQNTQLFQTGSLVFAKQRGSRPWPAKIVAIEKFPKYKVFFFGSNNYGTVSFGGLHLFCEETKSEFSQVLQKPKSKYMKDFVIGINEINGLHYSK